MKRTNKRALTKSLLFVSMLLIPVLSVPAQEQPKSYHPLLLELFAFQNLEIEGEFGLAIAREFNDYLYVAAIYPIFGPDIFMKYPPADIYLFPKKNINEDLKIAGLFDYDLVRKSVASFSGKITKYSDDYAFGANIRQLSYETGVVDPDISWLVKTNKNSFFKMTGDLNLERVSVAYRSYSEKPVPGDYLASGDAIMRKDNRNIPSIAEIGKEIFLRKLNFSFENMRYFGSDGSAYQDQKISFEISFDGTFGATIYKNTERMDGISARYALERQGYFFSVNITDRVKLSMGADKLFYTDSAIAPASLEVGGSLLRLSMYLSDRFGLYINNEVLTASGGFQFEF